MSTINSCLLVSREFLVILKRFCFKILGCFCFFKNQTTLDLPGVSAMPFNKVCLEEKIFPIASVVRSNIYLIRPDLEMMGLEGRIESLC